MENLTKTCIQIHVNRLTRLVYLASENCPLHIRHIRHIRSFTWPWELNGSADRLCAFYLVLTKIIRQWNRLSPRNYNANTLLPIMTGLRLRPVKIGSSVLVERIYMSSIWVVHVHLVTKQTLIRASKNTTKIILWSIYLLCLYLLVWRICDFPRFWL